MLGWKTENTTWFISILHAALGTNLCLIPSFNEKDTDTFFPSVWACGGVWGVVCLQLCVNSAVCPHWESSGGFLCIGRWAEFGVYYSEAVLKTYFFHILEHVKKGDKQTQLWFASDLICQFMHWWNSLNIPTFEALCDLLVLEKNFKTHCCCVWCRRSQGHQLTSMS